MHTLERERERKKEITLSDVGKENDGDRSVFFRLNSQLLFAQLIKLSSNVKTLFFVICQILAVFCPLGNSSKKNEAHR